MLFLASCSSTSSDNQPQEIAPQLSLTKGYQYTPNSRVCGFVSGWFSEFKNYSITPYRLSVLSEESWYRNFERDEAKKSSKNSAELVHAVKSYQQFPNELLSPSTFKKYFVEDFHSLTQAQKADFLSGAKMCHQYAEEANGKIVIGEASNPTFINKYDEREWARKVWENRKAKLCVGMERWVETISKLDLSTLKYTNRYPVDHIVFTEPFFNQVFYGRYSDLTANQLAGLSEVFSNQRVSFSNQNFTSCNHIHKQTKIEKFDAIFNYMTSAVRNSLQALNAKSIARRHPSKAGDAEKKEYQFITEVLLREHQLNEIEQFRQASEANLANTETLNKFLKQVITAERVTKPRGSNVKIGDQYLLDLKRKALDNFNVEQLIQHSLKEIEPRLPDNYEDIYKSSYSLAYRDSKAVEPLHFKQIAQMEELKEQYLGAYTGSEKKSQIRTTFDAAIDKIISNYVIIDQSQLSQLKPNIEDIKKSKLWLDDYSRFYWKYRWSKPVKSYYIQLTNKREELISKVWPSLEQHVASFDSSQSAETFNQSAINYNFDSKAEQGTLLIKLVQNRLSTLNSAERQEKEQQQLNEFLAKYYTQLEREHLIGHGQFKLPKNLPAPDEDTLFKTFYRVVKSHWRRAGYIQYIYDEDTIAMPVSAMGFKMRADTIVNHISIKSCQQISKNAYKCDYSLKYRVMPIHENAQLSAVMNQLSPVTESFLGIWQSGRKNSFSHVFTFTESGWWSDDMAEAYSKDQVRMDKISAAWQASRPKTQTCLNYKGFSFSCW